MIPRWPLMLLTLLPMSAGAFSRAPPPESIERQTLYPDGTYVLLIGMSDYRGRSWPALNGRRDAERMQQLFLQRGVPASAITLVEPAPGRGPALEEALVRFGAALPAGPGTGQRVIVYVAGHGYTSRGVGYLVPPDAPDPQDQPTAFQLSALPIATLLARVAAFRASHVLVILDSCFSGLALDSLPRERFAHPDAPGGSQQVLQVIAAGTAGQTVADDGMFADLIAAGLTGAADLNFDGWISGTELGMYLRLRMAENTQRRQTPVFGNVFGLGRGYGAGENWFASAQLPLQSLARAGPETPHDAATFRDCGDCPPLRVVPAPAGGADASYLAMGVHEVTFDEYDACFRAGGCTHWPWSPSGSRGRLPATDVNRNDALEYAHWLSCTTGGHYRLPTDREWLAAAHGEAARLASGAPSPAADCRGCGSAWDGREPAPAGSFQPDALGLYDLLGNVWEWVADCVRAAPGSAECAQGKVRGGAFTTRRRVVAGLPGAIEPALVRDRNIGFRIVRELEQASPAAQATCTAPDPGTH